MKKLLMATVAVAALGMVAPLAQAAIVSISDFNEDLGLNVNLFNQSTHPGDAPPGSGPSINSSNALANGITNLINVSPAVRESLSFTFANQINWSGDVYFYRYYQEPAGEGGGLSDLFVVQGIHGTTPDVITFISDDSLTGNISTDGPAVLAGSTASRVAISSPILEQPWQLAFDTGVDQYYVNSAPEPATLALLSVGLVGISFVRRRRG